MTFYSVEPEVAGGWGANTLADRTGEGATIVTRLHYEFAGWLGDELLETTPCFIVTEALGSKIVEAGLTGIELGEVEVSTSDQFHDLHGDRDLPDFRWLRVHGVAYQQDFGLTSGALLIVSEPALKVLKTGNIAHADIALAGPNDS